jgi:DNA-directed RNA polymerase specialized sigma24 family protein
VTDACYLWMVDGTADDLVTRLREVDQALKQQQQQVSQLASERRALVLELHDVHGWTDKRIAEALGVTRAAVQLIRSP